jgi:hypothetical protein
VRHLDRVLELVLAVARPEPHPPHHLDDLGVQAVDAGLVGGRLAFLADVRLDILLRLGDDLLDPSRVDAPVGHQLGQGQPGDLAADRVEPGQRHGVRRVVDDQVDAGGGFERADVAALAPNDPPLHLLVRDVDDGHGRLGDLVAGVALDRHPDDPPRPRLGRLGRFELDLAEPAGAGVADILLDLGDDDLAGLVGRHAGDALELAELVGAQLLGLAPLRLQLALACLEGALASLDPFELAVEVLFLLLEPLLLALDLRSALAVLLLGAGPQADRLVLRLEQDLLLLGGGAGAQPLGGLFGGLDRVGGRTLPQGVASPEADDQCDEPDDRHEDHVHDPHPLCEVSFRPFVWFLSARTGLAVSGTIRRVDSSRQKGESAPRIAACLRLGQGRSAAHGSTPPKCSSKTAAGQ